MTPNVCKNVPKFRENAGEIERKQPEIWFHFCSWKRAPDSIVLLSTDDDKNFSVRMMINWWELIVKWWYCIIVKRWCYFERMAVTACMCMCVCVSTRHLWFPSSSEDGVRLSTHRGHWKRSRTQSSRPMDCTIRPTSTGVGAHVYWVTLGVFSCGTLQQQQRFSSFFSRP